MALRVYGLLLILCTPVLILWVHLRRLRGREDPRRYRERYGIASHPQNTMPVIWFHAASVGEVISIFPILREISKSYPKHIILLTTTTRSSADYIARAEKPTNLIHQYAPLDHPLYVRRFIRQWRPKAGFFIESEIWPNLIATAHHHGVSLGLINARLSPRSFVRWQKWSAGARQIIGTFDHIFPQDKDTADRFTKLGIGPVQMLGNIKRDAPDLAYDAAQFKALQKLIAGRPVWLAASTHEDEEAVAMRAHHALKTRFPNLLTVIVPRHPDRVGGLMNHSELHGAPSCLFTQSDTLTAETEFLFGDTIGDMGLFYRLAPICFIGGTLIPHGGQNPLEPARLSCAIMHGPSIANFREIFADLGDAVIAVSRETLASRLAELLSDPALQRQQQEKAHAIIDRDRGTRDRILLALRCIIDTTETKTIKN